MTIDFTDYTKVTDVLFWFTNTVTLKFMVTLNKKKPSGNMRFFQYEVEYGADKFTNRPYRSINRMMDFCFVIDDKDDFYNGILLRPQDVEILLMFINEKILPWYFGDVNRYAFQIVNDRLALKEYTPVCYTQSESKYIAFEPIVMEYEDGSSDRGIRLSLSGNQTIDMNIDKFLGLFHILKSDMYSVACSIVNYAKMEPYGVNTLSGTGLGGGRLKEQDTGWTQNYSGQGAGSFLNNASSRKV